MRPCWYCGADLTPIRDWGLPRSTFSSPAERPVLELHAEREAPGGEHFLDLVERLAAQVRRLQQLGLGALDQVADVVDVLGLEAVGRAHRELEVVDRPQQDRVDLRLRRLLALLARGLQRREHRQLVDQDARGVAHRFFRLDHAVGLDVDDQLVEVGALLDARALHRVAHAAHRAERGVEQDRADGARVVLAARGRRHVAAALLDLDLHVELAARREVRDDVVGIDDLDVVRLLDVGGGDHAWRGLLQLERRLRAVVQLHHHALEVQDSRRRPPARRRWWSTRAARRRSSLRWRRSRASRTAGCGAARCRACGRSRARTAPS